MKIKNIRQFRSLFKEKIRRLSDFRDEHFVGVRKELNANEEVFGFFEIYHGDKEGFSESDGIRGFLEGFLDMAKDGQAVYEFMQNAVDAGSTKFCLYWGKDEVDGNNYLLVVNNGAMFNMDSIRSILNVGVSTKAASNFQIGKFGIGFKLAHRLVGRENGLDELIYDNYGPILFSWKQNEISQLENFIENPIVIPCNQDYEVFSENGKRKAIIKSNEPWLFKILITNFPCQPENETEPEIIHDNQYQETNKAFSKEELRTLGRWVKKYSDYLKNDFQEGALFFVRLGQGKQSHLEEENLEEGVKFSLAILNKIAKQSLDHDGLKTVNLRGKELEPVQLQFETFIISKKDNKQEYRFLRFGKSENLSEVELTKEQADRDIEILLGFTDYKHGKEAFHNAPNFYLFFPLSEEKHKLRFILHSNAFYKSSSRTYLQKGSTGDEGINERLFRVFVDKLKNRLLEWASSTDNNNRANFLQLYANLLLSDASDNPERTWVNEPLWLPILKFLESNIPVKNPSTDSFKLVNEVNKVRIKSTVLPVDSENWMEGKIEWFAWDFSETELSSEAAAKLKIERFNLIDLLQVKDVAEKLNFWLQQNKYSLVPNILQELNIPSIANIKQPDLFWNNLGLLQIWEFGDGFFSLENIGDVSEYSNRLILFDTLDAIKEQLIKSGWKLSKYSLAEYVNLFTPIQNRFQSVIKYIRRNEELINVLNLKLPDAGLSRSEKLGVLKVLTKKLSDDKEDRTIKLRELKLFRNTLGQIAPLKSLLKSANIGWLGSWVIHSEDYDSALDDYLISNPVDIYQNIVLPYWNEMVNRLTSELDIRSLFDYAKGVFKQNNKLGVLSEKEIVLVGKTFFTQSSFFFYSSSLSGFAQKEYSVLAAVLMKLNAPPLPSYDLLKYYEEQPFKITPKPFTYSLNHEIAITLDEAIVFLKLCTTEYPEVFKSLSVVQNSVNEILISPKVEGAHLVVSDNILVSNYIKEYHPNLFVILPSGLKEFGGSVNLQGTALVNRLSYECNFNDEKQLSQLIEIALQSEVEARKYLLNNIDVIHFDLNEALSSELPSVRFIKLLISIGDDNITTNNIKTKTTIISDNDTIKLSEVRLFGNDEVSFEKEDKKFLLSLSSILISTDSKATRIVGKLTEYLSELGVADKIVLDRMFGLTGQVDKSFIAEQVRKKYEDQVLENAHQLAFVLHYSTNKPKDFSIESFKIESENGPLLLKDVVLYTTENSQKYVPDNLVLNAQYAGLSKLIMQEASVYKGVSGVTICNSPYFDGNKLFIPGLSKIEAKENQLFFAEFLFGKWRNAKEQLINISLADNKKWNDFLGFEPFLTISGSDLILESEKLPEFVRNWLDKSDQEVNSKEKIDFIRALGVSLSGADIIRIRKYLIGQESSMPGINYSLPPVLIVNTFILLCNKKCVFSLTDARLQLLRDLYQRLPDETNLIGIPMPTISPVDGNTLRFDILTEGLLIESTSIDELKVIGYPIHQLPIDAGLPIIFAGLFRDVHKLTKFFPPVKLSFGHLDKNEIETNGNPWQRDFYFEWHKLFPAYEIIIYPGLIPRFLLLNGLNIFGYLEGDIDRFDNRIIVNGDHLDKTIVSLIESKNYLPPDARDRLWDLFNQHIDSFQEFLNRVQSNKKLKEDWEKLQRKDKEETKKKELQENFGTAARYSMAWFMNLLELMVISGGGKDLANPEGDITFNKVHYDNHDLRVISFGDPSKTIPPSIELFTDFKATFTYLDESQIQRTKEIYIKGLSKKGHEVLALPVNPNELRTINLEGILYVELRFIRILDLINKLTRAFKLLNFDDSYDLKKELTDNIQFIFGPPGTGKTTHISNLIIDRIEKKKSKNILVLTPTNKAADVLVKRVIEQCDENTFPEAWLVRFGASTDVDLLDRDLVYDGNTLKFHLYNQIVVVTTFHRFPYEKIITNEAEFGEEKTGLNEIAWDTIIFDEASMIMLPAIIYPLFKRKFKRYDMQEFTEFIIGGDPLQIPPIFDLPDEELPEDQKDVKEENIYTMIGLKSFKKEEQLAMERFGDKIENLTTQYRSIDIIGTLFSKFQYNNSLDHGRNQGKGGTPNPRPLPEYFNKLGFRPITVIRYPVNTSDTLFNPQKLNSSPFQLYSSFLVNELVIRLREHANDKWELGVIAPYRSQATLLNKLIDNHADKSKVNILTDTVHGFQGDQCDMIIAVFNPSSARSQFSYFLQKEYIINVAISRAKDYLFILLPDDETEGIERLNLIHESYSGSLLRIIGSLPKDMVAYIDAKDLERKIMGKADYFQKNSFTNIHQNVNIYSELVKDYIVRVGGNALDIHLKQQ